MIHAPRNWPQQVLTSSIISSNLCYQHKWGSLQLEFFFGQIFGLILHTHCRRPARLTEAVGIVLSYPWWASALSFKCFSICSLWHPGCPRALRLFKLLKGPQLFSLSCARMSQDAPGLPRMPTKTALGVRMKFALGLCPCILHTEFRVPHWNPMN